MKSQKINANQIIMDEVFENILTLQKEWQTKVCCVTKAERGTQFAYFIPEGSCI